MARAFEPEASLLHGAPGLAGRRQLSCTASAGFRLAAGRLSREALVAGRRPRDLWGMRFFSFLQRPAPAQQRPVAAAAGTTQQQERALLDLFARGFLTLDQVMERLAHL